MKGSNALGEGSFAGCPGAVGLQSIQVSERRRSGGWNQALPGADEPQDKRQGAGIDAWEIPPKCEEELLCCAGGQALEQAIQRECGVSFSGCIPKAAGHSPE